jgi:hypothetical protein
VDGFELDVYVEFALKGHRNHVRVGGFRQICLGSLLHEALDLEHTSQMRQVLP